MNKKIYQYQILIPGEYTQSITKKMTEIMKIEFDLNKLKKAERNEEYCNPGCICVFRDKESDERFVMVDTLGPNFLHLIVVQCEENEHELIYKVFLDAANEVRREYGYELIDKLTDRFDSIDNGYKDALKRCNVTRL